MRQFNSSSDEAHLPEGMCGIIGFQQVLTDDKKVHIWMKQEIDRPASTNRHQTTRRANQTHRKHEWGKSVWLKDEVYRHFGNALDKLGVTKEYLNNFQNDPNCDIWVTKNDGDRKFIQVLLINPISEITGQALNIQITQVEGKAPIEIYKRAYEESVKGFGDYKVLADKYKNSAMVRTYSSYVTVGGPVISRITPVYVQRGVEKLPVYESSEIVLGNPIHKFIEYDKFDSIPTDVLDFNESNSINIIETTIVGTSVPEEKELVLTLSEK